MQLEDERKKCQNLSKSGIPLSKAFDLDPGGSRSGQERGRGVSRSGFSFYTLERDAMLFL